MIKMSANDDAEMGAACDRAKQTFKYFWRELTWEYRRVVPGCVIKTVKVGLPTGLPLHEGPSHEHVWIKGVEFDGLRIRGALDSEPRWVKSPGARIETPFENLSDWIYSRDLEIFGGFTVRLLRSRMKPEDQVAHDKAWGVDFRGPPRVAPGEPDDEHPMSENMAPVYRKQLAGDPSAAFIVSNGWTQLHHFALGGSYAVVDALLDAAADPHARTPDGRTAGDLAAVMGWPRVVARLGAGN